MAESDLTDFDQRVEALRAARSALQDTGIGGSKLHSEVGDLLDVANWVMTGQKPLREVEMTGDPLDLVRAQPHSHNHLNDNIDGDPPE